MKKILILLLAALMLLTACAAMADTYSEDGSTIYYDAPYTGKTAEAGVKLRESAYASGKIVAELRKGVKLSVTAATYAKDGTLWYAAETTNRKTGWVPADQVTFEETASSGSSLFGGITYGSYIGNVNSHIYHLPTCRALPNRENQVPFSTKYQAVSEGYKPCKICKP